MKTVVRLTPRVQGVHTVRIPLLRWGELLISTRVEGLAPNQVFTTSWHCVRVSIAWWSRPQLKLTPDSIGEFIDKLEEVE